MTEWKSITNMNVKIPEDDVEVTINNYKNVKKKSAIFIKFLIRMES